MRTPNAECVVCAKPLYRRPFELRQVRYVACMKHRADAARAAGTTEAQRRGLEQGRQKGTNHRTGYKHREESRQKTSASNLAYWAVHPKQLAERGAKIRGANHYRWNGGASKLNSAVRRMTEHRKWMDAVKARDGACLCGSTQDLESHHVTPLAELIERHSITSTDDARNCAELWNISNGVTLCRRCHYGEHGRTYAD